MNTATKPKKTQPSPVLTGAVAWVLSFFLMLIAVVGVVICTLCNPSYLKSQVLESGFSQIVLDQLNENYRSYGNAGNIPEEVMTSILTQDQIQQDMFRVVESLYEGDRRLIAHPEVAQAVEDAVLQNLEERQISLTEEIEQAVKDMALGCQTDYDTYVQLVFTPYIAPYITKLADMAWLGLGIMALFALAALLVLFALQRSGPARLRWCINAFSAAALFSAVVPVLFNLWVKMDRLNLEPESLKTLLACYTHGAVGVFFYFALIYLVIVVALGIAWRAGLKRYRQAYRSRKEEMDY